MIPIEPKGYRMLVKQVVIENTTPGGLILNTDDELRRQQAGFPIYEVLAQGDACYKSRDGQEFVEGKWCEVGDTVIMDGYAGKAIQPKEFETFVRNNPEAMQELRDMARLGLKFHLVNDDAVMGVLKND